MEATVAILMGTYNGDQYIAEQIESLERQTHQNWNLIISDDGSTDQTLSVIKQKVKNWPAGKVEIRQGPRKGFCKNFLSLACDQNIKADYYAFCDQDDIWLPGKLEKAINDLRAIQKDSLPLLYCSRTAYVKGTLSPYVYSPLFNQKKSFTNAIFQNVAGGNTMVFNAAAKSLVEKAETASPAFHDWWMYQLITGGGGEIYYDPNPLILYRQHEASIVGGETLLGMLMQVWRVLLGEYKHLNDINIASLDSVRDLLSIDAKLVLDDVIKLRAARSWADRFGIVRRRGFYRQSTIDTLGLRLAAILGKV